MHYAFLCSTQQSLKILLSVLPSRQLYIIELSIFYFETEIKTNTFSHTLATYIAVKCYTFEDEYIFQLIGWLLFGFFPPLNHTV